MSAASCVQPTALCAAALLLCGAAAASDRPFLATSSAAAEEDDDGVWSFESTGARLGSQRSLSVQAEYAFDPLHAVQIELARQKSRGPGGSETGAGLEVRHLFNRIARDGWGWGVVLSAEASRAQGEAWHTRQWGLTFPFSLQWGTNGTLLHLNLGAVKARSEARDWTASLAVQHEIARRTVLFAEAGRQGEGRLLQGGLRFWLQREKLALDLALVRSRDQGGVERGFVIGIGLYDL